MPRGVYAHLDPWDGHTLALERFSCAPGPAGWRYLGAVSDASGQRPLGGVDVTVDARWRQVRVELSGGGWQLRGGVVGDRCRWVRRPATAEQAPTPASQPREDGQQAAAFVGRTPALIVAVARLPGLSTGETARLRLVEVSWPALAPMVVEQAWALLEVTEHATETAPLPVERYEVSHLGTGHRATVHLAGDVVLDAPELELRELASPPNV